MIKLIRPSFERFSKCMCPSNNRPFIVQQDAPNGPKSGRDVASAMVGCLGSYSFARVFSAFSSNAVMASDAKDSVDSIEDWESETVSVFDKTVCISI